MSGERGQTHSSREHHTTLEKCCNSNLFRVICARERVCGLERKLKGLIGQHVWGCGHQTDGIFMKMLKRFNTQVIQSFL